MKDNEQRFETLSADEMQQISGGNLPGITAIKIEPVKWLNSKHTGAPLWAIQAALAVGLEGEPV
jgi:bacteriocin-like protein